jgi:hypothetical protein
MYVKIELSLPAQKALLEIPETGMGYQHVYIYIRGPIPEPQTFRFDTIVVNGKTLDWPSSLGDPSEYLFVRFEQITRSNTHLQKD